MQLNPRHHIFQDAKTEFSKFWINFLEAHDLTTSEFLSILSAELQSMINICLQEEWKEAQREQRRSDSGRQADGD